MAASSAELVLSSACTEGMTSFYALFSSITVERANARLARLPVRAVFVEAHADRGDSLRQPAVHGTFEALWEFQRAGDGLDDERRVALGTGHAFFGDSRAARENKCGGESGIRTHGRISPTHAFQACSLNRSDISPHARRETNLINLAESSRRRTDRHQSS